MRARRLSEVGDCARAARFSKRAPRTLRCQLTLNELSAHASASAAPAAVVLQGRQAADQLQLQLLARLCNGLRSATKRHSVVITRCMHPLRPHAAAHCTRMQLRNSVDEQGFAELLGCCRQRDGYRRRPAHQGDKRGPAAGRDGGCGALTRRAPLHVPHARAGGLHPRRRQQRPPCALACRMRIGCLTRVRPRCLVTCAAAPPRLYCTPLPTNRLTLSAEESKHATRVLRLKAGDGVELFDGDGGCLSANIVAVDARGYAEVMPAGDLRRVPWQGPRWDIAVACTGMTQRADWAVEKCAELGLASLIPLLTERVDGRRQQRAEQSAEFQRWGRLSIAASKQCLRLHALKVAPPTPLSELLPMVRSSLTLVALQGGAPVREVLAAHSSAASSGGLLIVGPPVSSPAPLSGLTAGGLTRAGCRATSQPRRRSSFCPLAPWAAASAT